MTKLLTKLACCWSDDLLVMWSAGGVGEGGGRGEIFQSKTQLNISQSVADIGSFLLNFLWFVSSCLRGGAEYYEVRQFSPVQQTVNTAPR